MLKVSCRLYGLLSLEMHVFGKNGAFGREDVQTLP